MRVGVICRADERGLGRQAHELWRHLPDTSALVVRLKASEDRGFAPNLERYAEGLVVEVDTRRWLLPENDVRSWLETVDVVYAPETLYDWRLADWARAAGARTVVHVNPEFYRPRDPAPDAWWAPTGWRLGQLPPGTKRVPVPVASEDFTPVAHNSAGRLRVLHIVGHAAAADRNGSAVVGEATRHLTSPEWICRTQDRNVPGWTRRQKWAVEIGGRADHRALYEGADVLAMPRRYGGLSLVVNEAMAAGLAVVMTDCEPNREWPIVPVAPRRHGRLNVPAGLLVTHDVLPADLAAVVGRLEADRGELDDAQRRARRWATDNSWDALSPMILEELANVCD
jgi:glycosyltransferase involved in cell wall biosynthesis